MGNVIFKKRQAKGNDAQMKRNNANRTTKKDLRRMIVVSGIVVFGLVGFMLFSPLSSQFAEDGAGMDTCLKELDFVVGSCSFKMVKVDGGTFIMGATAEQENDAKDCERPAHHDLKLEIST